MTKINGRYYGSASAHPVTKGIYTQKNRTGCRPRLDLLMKEPNLQLRIHDGVVMVEVGRIKNRFHIFIKNHCRLTINEVIEGMGVPQWKGGIIVMRKGERPEDKVVGLHPGDAQLIDIAVTL